MILAPTRCLWGQYREIFGGDQGGRWDEQGSGTRGQGSGMFQSELKCLECLELAQVRKSNKGGRRAASTGHRSTSSGQAEQGRKGQGLRCKGERVYDVWRRERRKGEGTRSQESGAGSQEAAASAKATARRGRGDQDAETRRHGDAGRPETGQRGEPGTRRMNAKLIGMRSLCAAG
jgi:hypothetical protein